MTEDTAEMVRPEVAAFVADVRALMADLDADERAELTGGLEADLSEQVADDGLEALGDPRDYARELRLAGGHSATMAPAPPERRVRTAVSDALDAARLQWDRLLDSLVAGGPRSFMTALQPAWWLVRAWVAWMVAQDMRGLWVSFDTQWLLTLAVFMVVSVQLGRRAWHVDRLLPRSVLARLLLVGLNVFALTMLPGAADRTANRIALDRSWMYEEHASPDVNPAVITYQDRQSCSLRVFNAEGKRVLDARVVDQFGRALPMRNRQC